MDTIEIHVYDSRKSEIYHVLKVSLHDTPMDIFSQIRKNFSFKKDGPTIYADLQT